MAVTIYAYNDFKEKLLNGSGVDLDTDTIKVSLHTSTYSPDIDVHDFYDDVTNEISDASYTAGGLALTNKTVSQDNANDRSVFDADDLVFVALTGVTFRYGVIYQDTGTPGTSTLIAYIDFGTEQTPNGTDLVIQWHTEGIMYI